MAKFYVKVTSTRDVYKKKDGGTYVADKTNKTKTPGPNLESNTDNKFYVTYTPYMSAKINGKYKEVKASASATKDFIKLGDDEKTKKTMEQATDKYRVQWKYYVEKDGWFPQDASDEDHLYSYYEPPENASKIGVRIKPIAKDNKDGDAYYSGKWTKWYKTTIDATTNNPEIPSSPSIICDYDNGTYYVECESNDENTVKMEFKIFTRAYSFGSGIKEISEESEYKAKASNATDDSYIFATSSKTLPKDCTIYVQAKGINSDGEESDWSDISEGTPGAVSSISKLVPYSKSGDSNLKLKIEGLPNKKAVDSTLICEIQYVIDEEYFKTSESSISSTSVTIESSDDTYTELLNMDLGYEYCFRARLNNGTGYSEWSDIIKFVMGTEPDAPTIWSNLETIVDSEETKLYIYNNLTDNSAARKFKLELTYDNNSAQTIEVDNVKDEYDAYKFDTFVYTPTATIDDGTILKWRCCAKGIYEGVELTTGTQSTKETEGYGDWSDYKTIKYYKTPTLTVSASSSSITATLGSSVKQTPVGYSLEIIATSAHKIALANGTTKSVSDGEIVISKYSDSTSGSCTFTLDKLTDRLGAGESYTVKVTVATNGGLTGTATTSLTTSGSGAATKSLTGTITYSSDLTAKIAISSGQYSSGGSKQCYRLEPNGRLTKLSSISGNTYTDEYVGFNYVKYRLVDVVDCATVYYNDISAEKRIYDVEFTEYTYPRVTSRGIFIQWDNDEQYLALPYNVDTSPKYATDSTTIEYDGRVNPVSYYGIKQSETDTWKTAIVMDDYETLNKLRELGIWCGPVHVRNAEGSSFDALIDVSITKNHNSVLLSASLSITRIESEG